MNTRLFIVLNAIWIAAAAVFAQWEPDRKLSTTDSSAQLNENMGPCIATCGDTVHVTWCDSKNNGSAICYKRSTDAGMTWGADTRLSSTPGHADFPAIAVSGTTVHLVFRDTRTPHNLSYYRQSVDAGSTWGPEVFLDTAYWWPSIAVSGPLVYVVLNDTIIRNDTSNSEVYFQRSLDNGTSWGAVQQISNSRGRSEDPAIATDGPHVYLAWNDNRTGIMQTWYRASVDSGTTWGTEMQLTNTTVFAYSPMVSVNGSNVCIPWEDRRNNNNFDIYLLRSTDFGATWGPEVRMTQDIAVSAYPYFVANGNNAHLAWFNMPGGVCYTKSGDAGVNWDPATAIVDSVNQPMHPFIALSRDVVHVIWSDMRDGHRAIYYKRNPTGNSGATGVSSRQLDHAAAGSPQFASFHGSMTGMRELYDLHGRMVIMSAGGKINNKLPQGIYLLRTGRSGAEPIRVIKMK